MFLHSPRGPSINDLQSYVNWGRKYEAYMLVFLASEQSSEGKRDDVSNSDQVRQLQEQLRQKDNDMTFKFQQMKAIAAQLNAEAKVLEQYPPHPHK